MIEHTECIICKAPLGQESRDSGFPTCHEHRKCIHCDKVISARHLRVILQQLTLRGDDLTPDLIVHDNCALQKLASESTNGKIPVTLAEVDLLNRYRLCFEADTSLSEDANTKIAESALPALINDMTLEGKFLFMRRTQIIAARMSIILSSNRESIKEELKQRHHKEYEEIQKIRKKIQETGNTPSNTYGYSQKTWDNMSKVEKKRVRNREKAITALTEIGIDRKTAEASVDSHKK